MPLAMEAPPHGDSLVLASFPQSFRGSPVPLCQLVPPVGPRERIDAPSRFPDEAVAASLQTGKSGMWLFEEDALANIFSIDS